jgi:hypothetical protein
MCSDFEVLKHVSRHLLGIGKQKTCWLTIHWLFLPNFSPDPWSPMPHGHHSQGGREVMVINVVAVAAVMVIAVMVSIA